MGKLVLIGFDHPLIGAPPLPSPPGTRLSFTSPLALFPLHRVISPLCGRGRIYTPAKHAGAQPQATDTAPHDQVEQEDMQCAWLGTSACPHLLAKPIYGMSFWKLHRQFVAMDCRPDYHRQRTQQGPLLPYPPGNSGPMYVRRSHWNNIILCCIPRNNPLDSPVPSIAAEARYLALRDAATRLHLSIKFCLYHIRVSTCTSADADLAAMCCDTWFSQSLSVTTSSSAVQRGQHAADRSSYPFTALFPSFSIQAAHVAVTCPPRHAADALGCWWMFLSCLVGCQYIDGRCVMLFRSLMGRFFPPSPIQYLPIPGKTCL